MLRQFIGALFISAAIAGPVTITALSSNPTNYNISYSLNTLSSSVYQWAITLNLYNYNVSAWTSTTTTANNGVWVGIGFNYSDMDGADLIKCGYIFTNKSTDGFTCINQVYDDQNGSILPWKAFTNSTPQNVYSVVSGPGLVRVNQQIANFTVNLYRNLTVTP